MKVTWLISQTSFTITLPTLNLDESNMTDFTNLIYNNLPTLNLDESNMTDFTNLIYNNLPTFRPDESNMTDFTTTDDHSMLDGISLLTPDSTDLLSDGTNLLTDSVLPEEAAQTLSNNGTGGVLNGGGGGGGVLDNVGGGASGVLNGGSTVLSDAMVLSDGSLLTDTEASLSDGGGMFGGPAMSNIVMAPQNLTFLSTPPSGVLDLVDKTSNFFICPDFTPWKNI